MKKKVALIFIGNIEFCPYVKEYKRILEDLRLDYNIIFWKRENLRAEYPNNYYFFDFSSSVKKRKVLKTFDFLRYALWMKKIIKENSYTHLIFLDTISGMLAYLNGCITPGMNAIWEIRDYTYEKIKLFKFVEKKMLHKMKYVFISSLAFKRFLPNFDYCITHNFNEKEYMQFCKSTEYVRKPKGKPLNIVYTGALKYFNYQKTIIEELKNDSKINIIFHGIGPDYARLRKYCCEKNIRNIKFTGLYTEDQKPEFYKEADFLINCYDIHLGNEVLYAVSNKYYDGLIYHIPQLSEDKTYKGSLVEKNEVGITWRPEEGNLKEKIMNFYYSIDEENFNKSCVDNMEDYYIEYKQYTGKINDFLQSH